MCCLYHPVVSVGTLRYNDSHRSWRSESGIAKNKELGCDDYGLKAIEVHGLMAFTSPLFQRGIRHPAGKMPMCSEVPALCLPLHPRDQREEAPSSSWNGSSQRHQDGRLCLFWGSRTQKGMWKWMGLHAAYKSFFFFLKWQYNPDFQDWGRHRVLC